MISDKERCARLLKKIWVRNGVVAASAFNLRPAIHEAYISMLREDTLTFGKDIQSITQDNPIIIASLLAGDVRSLRVQGNTTLDICEIDNERLKSHCGLFISVESHRIVGGEPFITKDGEPVDTLVMRIKLSLAKMASKSLRAIRRG